MNMKMILFLTVSNLIVVFVTIFFLKLTFWKKVCIMLMSMNGILAQMYSLMSGVEVADILKDSNDGLEDEEKDNQNTPEWFQG